MSRTAPCTPTTGAAEDRVEIQAQLAGDAVVGSEAGGGHDPVAAQDPPVGGDQGDAGGGAADGVHAEAGD